MSLFSSSSYPLLTPYAFKLQLIKIEDFCFVYPLQIPSWKHHGFTFNVRATIWIGDCNPVGSQISNFLIPRENPTENRCRVSSLESGYRSRHVWTWRSTVSRREFLRSSNTLDTLNADFRVKVRFRYDFWIVICESETEQNILCIFFLFVRAYTFALGVFNFWFYLETCNFWICTLTITF